MERQGHKVGENTVYKMGIEEVKQMGDTKREESFWPVVNSCFTDPAVTWRLRPANCQNQASSILPLPSVFIQSLP